MQVEKTKIFYIYEREKKFYFLIFLSCWIFFFIGNIIFSFGKQIESKAYDSDIFKKSKTAS